MNWDDLQKEWKQREPEREMDMEQVLNDVQARAAKLRRAVMWRDVREVGASVFVVGLFGWIAASSPGCARLGALAVAAAAVFVGVFMLVDRWLHKKRLPEADSTRGRLERDLADVRHQMWLLRNVFWWYMLPFILGTAAWAVGLAISSPLPWYVWPIAFIVVGGPVDWGIYRLNQKALRDDLMPQERELAARLDEWKAMDQ